MKGMVVKVLPVIRSPGLVNAQVTKELGGWAGFPSTTKSLIFRRLRVLGGHMILMFHRKGESSSLEMSSGPTVCISQVVQLLEQGFFLFSALGVLQGEGI